MEQHYSSSSIRRDSLPTREGSMASVDDVWALNGSLPPLSYVLEQTSSSSTQLPPIHSGFPILQQQVSTLPPQAPEAWDSLQYQQQFLEELSRPMTDDDGADLLSSFPELADASIDLFQTESSPATESTNKQPTSIPDPTPFFSTVSWSDEQIPCLSPSHINHEKILQLAQTRSGREIRSAILAKHGPQAIGESTVSVRIGAAFDGIALLLDMPCDDVRKRYCDLYPLSRVRSYDLKEDSIEPGTQEEVEQEVQGLAPSDFFSTKNLTDEQVLRLHPKYIFHDKLLQIAQTHSAREISKAISEIHGLEAPASGTVTERLLRAFKKIASRLGMPYDTVRVHFGVLYHSGAVQKFTANQRQEYAMIQKERQRKLLQPQVQEPRYQETTSTVKTSSQEELQREIEQPQPQQPQPQIHQMELQQPDLLQSYLQQPQSEQPVVSQCMWPPVETTIQEELQREREWLPLNQPQLHQSEFQQWAPQQPYAQQDYLQRPQLQPDVLLQCGLPHPELPHPKITEQKPRTQAPKQKVSKKAAPKKEQPTYTYIIQKPLTNDQILFLDQKHLRDDLLLQLTRTMSLKDIHQESRVVHGRGLSFTELTKRFRAAFRNIVEREGVFTGLVKSEFYNSSTIPHHEDSVYKKSRRAF